MGRLQRTIRTAAEIEGVGLHSGETVRLRVEPAEPGTGVLFHRTDLEDSPEIPARYDHLAHSERCTALRRGRAAVQTTEHLLAACHGLEVDNLLVLVDGEEMPGLDGSAAPFAALLQEAGIVEQAEERRALTVTEPVHVREGQAGIVALPPTTEGLRIRYLPEYRVPFDERPILFELSHEAFLDTISPARTFCLADEVEPLRAAGLGKGATVENTVVLGTDPPPELRMEREPTRHKVLDLLGDLFLLGIDLHADLICTASGHALNQELVGALHAFDEKSRAEEGVLDTGFDIRAVMRLLPHRYPFLLIDRVIEVEGFRRAVGIKNVTINEPFFQGHWPDQPIMPGVLQLEAMAQLSGFLLQRKLEHSEKLVVLWSIDKVRFRSAVVPGDQLRIECETLRLSRSRGQIHAQARVGSRPAADAILTFTIREP